MPHIKESLRALAGEKKSSKKAAYRAALFVRRAYAMQCRQMVAKASSGDSESALSLMREMTNEALALKALGYAIDGHNPAFLQAKTKLPPLVKFENVTQTQENDPMGSNDGIRLIQEEAKKRGVI